MQAKRLHAYIFGFEKREELAVLVDAQDGRRRGCAHIGFSVLACDYRPHEGRRCGEHLSQAWPFAEVSVAADGDALRSAFFELIDARLGPQVGALRTGRLCRENNEQRRRKGRESCCERGEMAVGLENKHAAVESTKNGGQSGRMAGGFRAQGSLPGLRHRGDERPN